MPRLSWTQPVCEACWEERYPGRFANRLREPERETCVDCGKPTWVGIYIRINPTQANYPTLEKD